MAKRKRKKKANLLLAYFADISCLTNRSFYTVLLRLNARLIRGGVYFENFEKGGGGGAFNRSNTVCELCL